MSDANNILSALQVLMEDPSERSLIGRLREIHEPVEQLILAGVPQTRVWEVLKNHGLEFSSPASSRLRPPKPPGGQGVRSFENLFSLWVRLDGPARAGRGSVGSNQPSPQLSQPNPAALASAVPVTDPTPDADPESEPEYAWRQTKRSDAEAYAVADQFLANRRSLASNHPLAKRKTTKAKK